VNFVARNRQYGRLKSFLKGGDFEKNNRRDYPIGFVFGLASYWSAHAQVLRRIKLPTGIVGRCTEILCAILFK
jgi:hypothetical protein